MLNAPFRLLSFHRAAPLIMLVGIASIACSSSSVPDTATPTTDPTTTPAPTATIRPRPTATPERDLGSTFPLLAETLNGRQVSMSGYAGSPIVLYFWREHVTGVERELELMQELYETYSPLGVEFLTVTDREHGNSRRRQTILDNASATLPTVVLANGDFGRSFGFELPVGVILINKDQRVVWKWNGFLEPDKVITEVANLAGVQPLPSRHSASVVIGQGFREDFIPESLSPKYDELESALEPLKNQPVVVFVWASGISSEAQRRSLETFIKVREEFEHQSVGFLGLVAESDALVEQWRVDPDDFEFPVVIDDQSRLMIDMGIFSFPTTFYLDHLHRIAGIKAGALNLASAKHLVRNLISERAKQPERSE